MIQENRNNINGSISLFDFRIIEFVQSNKTRRKLVYTHAKSRHAFKRFSLTHKISHHTCAQSMLTHKISRNTYKR